MVNRRGVVLIFSVILLSILLVLVGAFLMITRQAQKSANNSVNTTMADLAAKTGLNDAQRVIRWSLTGHNIITPEGVYDPSLPTVFLNTANHPEANDIVRVNPFRYFQADAGDPYAILESGGTAQATPPKSSFTKSMMLLSPGNEGWALQNVMRHPALPVNEGLSPDFLFSTNNTKNSVKTLHANRDGSNPIHIGSERGEYYVWVEDMDSKLYGRPQGWGVDTTNAQGGTPLQDNTAVQTGVLNWLLSGNNPEPTPSQLVDIEAAKISDALVPLEDKSTTPLLRSMQELALWVKDIEAHPDARAALDYYFTVFKDEANFSNSLPTKFCKDYKTAININTAPVEVIAAALSQIPADTNGQTLQSRALKIAERMVAKRPFLCRMDFEDYLAAQIKGTTNNPAENTAGVTNVLPADNDPVWTTPTASIWTDPPISYVLYYAIGRRPGPGNTLPPSNDKVLFVGGYSGGALASAERYPATSTNPLNVQRYNHTSTLLSSGKVLVVGGVDDSGKALDSAELYNPVTNTWTSAGALIQIRSNHTATLLPNGKVLVAGGVSSGVALESAELYDPVTNTWSPADILSSARYNHTATLMPNGLVLVVGGEDDFGVLNESELYDPAMNLWSDTDFLFTARTHHTATLLPNGKVLVVGGYDTSDPTATEELYDPTAETWDSESASALTKSRSRHTATLLFNGKVLIAGGEHNGVALDSAEMYDPAVVAIPPANPWTSAGTLTSLRYKHAATLLPSGKVLLTGGDAGPLPADPLNEPPVSPMSSAEFYDPSIIYNPLAIPPVNPWVPVVALTVARTNHTATLMPTDNLYAQNSLPEMSLSQYLEIPGVADGDPHSLDPLQMMIDDKLVPTTPTPVASWPNEPRYQRARFRYFFDQANRSAKESEKSLLTVKEFNNIINSVTNIYASDDVQEHIPYMPLPAGTVMVTAGLNGTLETIPNPDDTIDPLNPLQIIAGPGGGKTFVKAGSDDVQVNNPPTFNPFGTVMVSAGANGLLQTQLQGDDYYYNPADPANPSPTHPTEIRAGNLGGKTRRVSSNSDTQVTFPNRLQPLPLNTVMVHAQQLQTLKQGDDTYDDPVYPTKILAGPGGGATTALGLDIQLNTPGTKKYPAGTVMVVSQFNTTPQGDDSYDHPTSPTKILAGPSGGSTWVSRNRPSYYSYFNSNFALNNFWGVASNFDFDVTANLSDSAVITKKADEKTLAQSVRVYSRCKTNLPNAKRPATQIDDLKSWRALPLLNAALSTDRRAGFYQTTVNGNVWTTTSVAPNVYDYGFLQSMDDPNATASTTPAVRSTASPSSGINQNGDVSWSPQFAYRSRFYHIYVLGRGLIATKEGAASKLSGETRMEAFYDALEDKTLWTRTQLSDKRALGEP